MPGRVRAIWVIPVAEGVEAKRHEEAVRALGLRCAGVAYGKPTNDPTPAEEHEAHMTLWAELGLEDMRSPFEVLGGQPIIRAPRELLLSLTDEVLRHGLRLQPPALLVVLVPDPDLLHAMHFRIVPGGPGGSDLCRSGRCASLGPSR